MKKLIKKIKLHKKKCLGLGIFLFLLVIFGAYYQLGDGPSGTNFISSSYNVPVEDIDFLYDLSYEDEMGRRHYQQEIFDQVFTAIDEADEYILLDMFLFNSYKAKSSEEFYRDLAGELANKLIERKLTNPEIQIDFITDPINIVYGGAKSKEIESLKSAGINVVISDLTKIKDANIIYSSFWRLLLQWFGNSQWGGILKHPFAFDGKKVTFRSYLTMLNFRANHRKVFLADSPDGVKSIIMSANPHNGSSAHSNVAIKILGSVGQEIVEAEQAVVNFSNSDINAPEFVFDEYEFAETGIAQVQYVTESKIKENIIKQIKDVKSGDRLFLALFYLSERDVINELLQASKRGVEIKIVLDPNKDAFGYKKIGIPNRQVARELVRKSLNKIQVRWYDTNGEQFHSKMIFIDRQDGQASLILGSANYTRRNLNNYNLEADIAIKADNDSKLMNEVRDYTNMIFDNPNNYTYTLDYSEYEDKAWWKIPVYYIQEYVGLSSF